MPLADTCALIAEDNAFILMGLQMMLEDNGINIAGSAASLAEAMTLAEIADADVAILDITLKDEMVFPAADILIARGIPVIFSTGHLGGEIMPDRFAHVTRVTKPYHPEVLLKLIQDVVARKN